ncbi:hypothetical protein EES41_05870 [Streptomyces sp. ADI95-16]|uniref:DUF2180 family protein n=1 Tax=Streptomyces sp. ADI95-16 TaxID=1522758 RepID=UPI000F3AA7B8|nr:hypothetical protein EES41_05870 [Streptomyces sp. ADI95-16]
MLCLDCNTAGTTSPAVGVCRGCGAAVCANHARVIQREVRRRPLLAPPVETAARTVHCFTCAAVHTG